MGMLDAFNQLNSVRSFESANETYNQHPVAEFDRGQSDPNAWLDRYAKFTTRPGFNSNVDGYFSAYSGHWGSYSDVMQTLNMSMELGPAQEKVEPNKIFTSDIAALKTLAADQAKIVKVFERKVMESLNDKGKFGVNEDDIEALQALTAARNALTSIQKEQINVKKNIAELKIKQQQAGGVGSSSSGGMDGRPASAYAVGRSIMDQIFDTPVVVPTTTETPINANYPTVDLDQAANVLDSIVDSGSIAASTVYESDEPTTYVLVGDSDTDTQFITISSSGDILGDYPNPSTKIASIDREAKTATDELMVSYPIKTREELNL